MHWPDCTRNAVNHQVANEPVIGREAIRQMFISEFAAAELVCLPENIFCDGEWVIMEWKDPKVSAAADFFMSLKERSFSNAVIGAANSRF